MKNKFDLAAPIKFKGETTVKDNETGKLHKAEFKFVGKHFILSEDRQKITFDMENDQGVLWELDVLE